MVGLAHQSAVPVEQTKINSPGIETQGRYLSPELLAAPGQTLFHLGKQIKGIPIQMIVDTRRTVGKTVRFCQRQSLTVKTTDNGSTAFGP